jgi:CopG family transcriptional regulator / antitoxin EndoAI
MIMHKRLNITLPENTVALIDEIAPKGDRSLFIDIAVRAYIMQNQQETLREKLKEGAIARSLRDSQLSSDWFDLEEEIWTK